jgi:O-antigen/teichoic acid export membrane protein
MTINVTAAGISVALNLLLIPRYGLYGAAAATLIASAAGFCAHLVLGRAYFPASPKWMHAFATLPLLAALIWAGSTMGEPSLAVSGARSVLLALGGAALAAFMLGPAELRMLLARISAQGRQR